MVRIILGVIAGFLVWSILWLGSDQVLINFQGLVRYSSAAALKRRCSTNRHSHRTIRSC